MWCTKQKNSYCPKIENANNKQTKEQKLLRHYSQHIVRESRIPYKQTYRLEKPSNYTHTYNFFLPPSSPFFRKPHQYTVPVVAEVENKFVPSHTHSIQNKSAQNKSRRNAGRTKQKEEINMKEKYLKSIETESTHSTQHPEDRNEIDNRPMKPTILNEKFMYIPRNIRF